MADKPPTFDELHNRLMQATKFLDEAARMCRDLDFNRQENIRKIGYAMTLAFEITNQIYVHPDLAPDWWKEKK